MEENNQPANEGKRNWKSYFREFIMLFLAVFCGFLAEYKLQHMMDDETEKEYIISFYNDLKYDTAHINGLIIDYTKKEEKLKEISLCYDSVINKLPCKSCLINLLRASQSFSELKVTDRTMQQLKNAGGLRLLNPEDADSILAYDNSVRSYKIDESTTYQETQTAIRNITSEVFNYAALNNLDTNVHNILITDDKIVINRYFFTLSRYARYSGRYALRLEKLKSDATNLINYFNNKYHIE